MIAIIAAQAADLLTALLMVSATGIDSEANPIARTLFLTFGVLGLLIPKGVLISVLAVSRRSLGGYWGITKWVCVALGLVGAASNVIVLLQN